LKALKGIQSGDAAWPHARLWQAVYNTGHWHVSVRGNPSTGISPVPITQICSMKIID